MPVTGVKRYRFLNGIWVGMGVADIVDTAPPPPPPPGVPAVPPIWLAEGNRRSSTGSISPPWPAHLLNDIGLLVVATAGGQSITAPTGWAHVLGSPIGIGSGTGSTTLNIMWKRAASSSESPPATGDSGDHQTGRVVVIRGCITTGNPWDVGGTDTLAAPGSTAVSIPGAITTVEQCLVVLAVANARFATADQGSAFANPLLTGVAGRSHTNGSDGIGGGWDLATGVKALAGGAGYGATTATLANASAQARLSLALKPVPSGGGPPPPPPGGGAGSFRTMIGSAAQAQARWGSQPTPDQYENENSGGNIVDVGGYIDKLRTNGPISACIMIWPTGGNAQLKNPDGTFSPALWKARFDSFYSGVVTSARPGGGVAFLRAAVADGTFRGINTLDDFSTDAAQPNNGFTQKLTFAQIEDICRYVKVTKGWDWMPLIARGSPIKLKVIATFGGFLHQYNYLDAGYAQYSPSIDNARHAGLEPDAYFAAQVAAGAACGLGCCGGANISDRGLCDTPGWGSKQGSRPAPFCGMSPAEVLAAGRAALNNDGVHGFIGYSNLGNTGGFNYYYSTANVDSLGRTIQSALQTIYTESIGRNDAKLNIRSDLGTAS